MDALVAELTSLGGHIETGHLVKGLDELPPARARLLDITPRALLRLAGDKLSPGYRRALSRFRYGPGICKVDFALSGPVPWTAEPCRRAGTLHLGGTFEEIARSEDDVALGRHPERPYVLVVQAGVVDASRAPEGKHTLWAYCHVPSGSTVDMSERIEAQIEQVRAGLSRPDPRPGPTSTAVAEIEAHNPSYVGGDINAGAATLRQMVLPADSCGGTRTAPRLKGVYLCSAATPPGGGVHGMCGLGSGAVPPPCTT